MSTKTTKDILESNEAKEYFEIQQDLDSSEIPKEENIDYDRLKSWCATYNDIWVKLEDIKRVLENHRKCSSPISESCHKKILQELEYSKEEVENLTKHNSSSKKDCYNYGCIHSPIVTVPFKCEGMSNKKCLIRKRSPS